MSVAFPPRLRAVVFDLDGTLLDTAPEFVQVVHRLREEHSLARLTDDTIRAQVSNGARAMVTLALGLDENQPTFEDKRQRFLDIYRKQLGSATALFAGIQDLLQQLASAGISWGICTNKPSNLTTPLLETLDLRPAPASVVCPDDVSHPKPHPESLYLNCRQLQCQPSEVVYIGDHLRDIQAGRNAGMYTIAAAYGYIEEDDDPLTWGANRVARHGEELAQQLAEAFT